MIEVTLNFGCMPFILNRKVSFVCEKKQSTRTHLSLITSVDKPLSRHVLMAFLLGFISIISSLLLLFMKALTTHMQHATQNDLVIYDRGYPAFWLYAFHIKQKSFFCMREKTKQSLVVKAHVF
jgi:hypothetical protein